MARHRIVFLVTLVTLLAAVPAADAATRLSIRGGGFGHGVGMSQYGALGFAQNGHGYREILAHYYTGTSLARLESDPTVRVLLQPNRDAVEFTGAVQAGDRRLRPASTYRATLFAGTGVVLRSSSGRRLKTFPAPLRIVPPEGGTVRLVGGPNAGAYRGALEVRPARYGGLNAINAVGLEDYVRGVVSAESPASWPAEALKAQAVAARTYAITTSKRGLGFEHYADTRSQVYRGVAAETETTDAAVAATAGEVVTYEGEPVTTYFFSTSGGRTENVEYGLGGEPKPWLKSVEDPYDEVSPRHRWGPMRMTLREAERKLRGLVKGRFRGIEVKQRGQSPRIVRAEIVGSRGRTEVSGATLRSRFGLYDTWAYFAVIRTDIEKRRGGDGQRRDGEGDVAARSSSREAVIEGRITGVERGETVDVRRRSDDGRYVTETRTKVRAHGRYRASLTRPGVYRVHVNGLYGAPVRLR